MLEDAIRRLGKPASPKEPLSLNYSEIQKFRISDSRSAWCGWRSCLSELCVSSTEFSGPRAAGPNS